jgi:hypothetical protein
MNAYAAAARARKALRLLHELTLVQGREPLAPGDLAVALRGVDEGWWGRLAQRAGVRMPSAETRALVIETVAGRAG